ncbi:Protein of unknown function [Gryllus bimaculatus]|nr:Protein of unknown function [Gryllus bimaculatus]
MIHLDGVGLQETARAVSAVQLKACSHHGKKLLELLMEVEDAPMHHQREKTLSLLTLCGSLLVLYIM